MKRIGFLIATALVLLVTLPSARAGFSTTPTFDLTTSSNLAGATDAVYTLHLENPDQSEDAITVSVTVPAGYSINQKFITNKSGIKAGSAYGHCPAGSAQANIATTTTPGHFTISFMNMAAANIIVSEPTPTTPGTMEFAFVGTYALMNSGCYADVSPAGGFFVNPPTPGTYTWGPSTAEPKSGPTIEMVPRPGFTQTIQIIGPSVTTQAATSITESSIVPTTTVLPATTQATVLPATTTPIIVTEPETTTTQPAPTGGAFPTETLAIVAVILIIIVVGAVYSLRRRK